MADQGAGLHEVLKALLEKEGIALRVRDQAVGDRAQRRIISGQMMQKVLRRVGGERVDADVPEEGLARPTVPVLRPERDEQENARGDEAVDEAIQQRLRFAVDPLQILHEDEERRFDAPAHEKLSDGLKRALATMPRIERVPRRVVVRDVEHRKHRRQHRFQRGVDGAKTARDRARRVVTVLALPFEEVLQQLARGEIRAVLSVRQRVASQHAPFDGVDAIDELPAHTRLPDARLADDRHELPASGPGGRHRALEFAQLNVTADERREPARGGDMQARGCLAESGHFVDVDVATQAFDRQTPERRRHDEPFREARRTRRRTDRTRRRGLLHARGEVRRLSDRGVVHSQVAAHGPHDDLARMEADANEDLRTVARDRVTHVERGVARPHRVILVRDRSTEERHDPVAHHLVHGALVTMHGVHHQLQHGSTIFRASSGSRSPRSSIDPLTSANRTVICFRSPSIDDFDVRMRSAMCFGVYVSGELDGARRVPHSEQNFACDGWSRPTTGTVHGQSLTRMCSS